MQKNIYKLVADLPQNGPNDVEIEILSPTIKDALNKFWTEYTTSKGESCIDAIRIEIKFIKKSDLL